MTPEEIAEKEAATAAAEAEAKAKAEAEANPDPLKARLEEVQGKKVRTEAEKAAFSLMKNAERAKELGLDPKKVLGLTEDESDDEKPLTHGDLRKLNLETAQKTALSLTDRIENENERELTKYHLSNTVRPSGNAEEDFNNARAIVNAEKNRMIAEEAQRKSKAKGFSSAAGSPGKTEDVFEPTPEEQQWMRAPWNMTEKQILEARKKAQV